MTTKSVDIKRLAGGIAADIREHGHFQGVAGQELYNVDDGSSAKCCIVVSPTFYAEVGEGSAFSDAEVRLAKAVGYHGPKTGVREFILHWNDETPTADVLATLDRIAAGAK